MTNKEFEKLFNNVKPVLPSQGLKERVLSEAKRIPVVSAKPINKGLTFVRRYAMAIGCLIFMIIASFTLLGVYGESYYEVYIDVNPSIEVCVNRFGVVSKVKCLNADAESCLDGVKLKGMRPEEAVTEIAYALSSNGYFDKNFELYLSGYSEKDTDVNLVVESLYYRLFDLTETEGYGVDVYTGEFTKEQRLAAEKVNVSPLKYSIITEVSSLDDGYTFDELKDRPMAELNYIYYTLKNALTKDVLDGAKAEGVSPMHYKLVTVLKNQGVSEELLKCTTKELKKLYVEIKTKSDDELNEEIAQKAEEYGVSTEVYRLAYSIVSRDGSYKIEDLLKKSVFELKALDYALEKYDVIKDLFG